MGIWQLVGAAFAVVLVVNFGVFLLALNVQFWRISSAEVDAIILAIEEYRAAQQD